jgi:glycosyltransferase involved in cell wall biosynthesis
LVRAGDSEALARELRALLSDPDRRREMGNRAVAVARLYSWENCARGTFDVLRDVHMRDSLRYSPVSA